MWKLIEEPVMASGESILVRRPSVIVYKSSYESRASKETNRTNSIITSKCHQTEDIFIAKQDNQESNTNNSLNIKEKTFLNVTLDNQQTCSVQKSSGIYNKDILGSAIEPALNLKCSEFKHPAINANSLKKYERLHDGGTKNICKLELSGGPQVNEANTDIEKCTIGKRKSVIVYRSNSESRAAKERKKANSTVTSQSNQLQDKGIVRQNKQESYTNAILDKPLVSNFQKSSGNVNKKTLSKRAKPSIYLKCSECEYMTVKSDSFKKHERLHNKSRKYVCDICGHRFNKKPDIRCHMQRHSKIEYSCTMCNYKCGFKNTLQLHLKTHKTDKPYFCTYCEYRSNQSCHLILHLRKHTGEKPYSCSVCSFKCSRSGILTNHMRTHTKEKPFACKLCDYKSTQKANLQTHMRVHTGDKPLSCTYCSYKAVGKTHLDNHIRKHTGEKPFTCTNCPYKTTTKYNLKHHMLLHTGEKPFSCPNCNYSSRNNQRLLSHIKKHHNQ